LCDSEYTKKKEKIEKRPITQLGFHVLPTLITAVTDKAIKTNIAGSWPTGGLLIGDPIPRDQYMAMSQKN
jgi:hypothetical protein